VGTNVGVERIGFEHERHGLVSDTPEGLAESTVRVLADDESAARFARAGRDLVRQFRWELATAAVEPRYREWRDARPAAGRSSSSA
jgi:hypothetical protein